MNAPGIEVGITELEAPVVCEDGRILRYILTSVKIPPDLRIGGFRFNPETGGFSWSQDSGDGGGMLVLNPSRTGSPAVGQA